MRLFVFVDNRGVDGVVGGFVVFIGGMLLWFRCW